MTAINGQRPATASHDTERPVPRWAVVTAHAIPFVLLPQCLWRLPFAPGWLPVIGGRRIPPLAAIIPATLGGLAATALWGSGPLAWLHVPGFHALGYSNGWWELLAKVCIGLATLWGPMVLALTYAYYVRRCRSRRSQ